MDVSRIPPVVLPINTSAVRPVAPAASAKAGVHAGHAKQAAPASGSSLWDLLTPEEQDFFTRQTALGPLTYGPASSASSAKPDCAPLGGRIDVKG